MRNLMRDVIATSPGDPFVGSGENAYRAVERRAWDTEYDALSVANESRALSGEDFERLALAAGLSGRDEDFLKAYERAHICYQLAGEFNCAARTAFWIGFRLAWLGQESRANGWLARSQRLVERSGGDCPERGYLLLPAVHRHLALNENDLACTVAREAAAIGERFSDNDLGVYARTLQGRAILWSGDTAAALSLLDEAMVAVVSGDLSPMFTELIYCSVIASYHEIQALHRAREWTAAFDDWCRSQPQTVILSGQCIVHRIELMMLCGQWTEASDQAQSLGRLGAHRPGPSVAGMGNYLQAEVHRLRGDFREAEEAYREAGRLGVEVQPGLALLRLKQGRGRDALVCLRHEVDSCESRGKRLRLLPALVEILLATGDYREARRFSDELITIALAMAADIPMAIALQASGMTRVAEGEVSQGLNELSKALAIWQSFGALYHCACVKAAMGSANLALGDHASAELSLDYALDVFRQLRAVPDLERLTRDATSSKTRQFLTSREMQVLRLVAGGNTNRSISSCLGLSIRTIDRHLSNIFTKLDVPSRAAATAFAYEHDLF